MASKILPNVTLRAGYSDNESGWGAGVNRNLRLLDALLHLRVQDRDLSAPPGSPADNRVWIVGPSATGAWVGREGQLALWSMGDDIAGAWEFIQPKDNWKAYVVDESKEYSFNGTTWVEVVAGGVGSSAWVDITGVPVPISDIAALTDPGADRLLMWDDSTGEYTHATLGTNLSFSGTTLNAAGGGGGGGGLTGFTSALNAGSPNTTTNFAGLFADTVSSNGGLALVPKGAGALTMQVPDNTDAGGNIRGAFAVDLQRQRGDATQVASGGSSVAIGASNTASGSSSIAIGDSHTVTSSSYGSAFGGYLNIVTGYAAVAIGGRGNSVSGNRSIALAGQRLSDRGIAGLAVFGCAATTSNSLGKRQGELYAWAGATSNATPTSLATDGGTAGAANQAVLANNSVICISGQVTARQSTGDVKCWTFSAAVKRDANAAATALVGTPTVTVVGADAGASAWAVDIIADTTNGALVVRATGEASKSIVWTASGMAAYAEA